MANIWTLLEQDAPTGCESVQDLYSWSLNYESGAGPFALYLDLIGWSDEHIGETIYDTRTTFGYVELAKIAAALTTYTERPHDVKDYVDALMAAESDDES